MEYVAVDENQLPVPVRNAMNAFDQTIASRKPLTVEQKKRLETLRDYHRVTLEAVAVFGENPGDVEKFVYVLKNAPEEYARFIEDEIKEVLNGTIDTKFFED